MIFMWACSIHSGSRRGRVQVYFFFGRALSTSTTERPGDDMRGRYRLGKGHAPGGRLCLSFSAFSGSSMERV